MSHLLGLTIAALGALDIHEPQCHGCYVSVIEWQCLGVSTEQIREKGGQWTEVCVFLHRAVKT